MKKCNDEILVLSQCETVGALEIIEEVVQLDGVAYNIDASVFINEYMRDISEIRSIKKY